MVVAPFLDMLLLLLVAAAAINDLASRRIPNLLLLSGFVAALALHSVSPEPGKALMACFSGGAVGLLVFLPLYFIRGMAAGDVKMMATVGAFTGPSATLSIAVFAWCAGGVMALAIIVYRGRLRLALTNLASLVRQFALRLPVEHIRTQPSAGSMPYGLAIAAGTIYFLTTH